jgi:uncharacterized protein (TIGR02246 family)
MKRLPCLMAGVLLAAFSTAATSPASAAEPNAADRAALLALAESMDRAWTAADVEANATLFTPDATARFGTEPLGRSRAAIRAQFQSFFAGRPPNLRHVTRIERLEQLAPDLALWDAEVRVEQRQQDGTWRALTTITNVTVAARIANGWAIKAVRAFPNP